MREIPDPVQRRMYKSTRASMLWLTIAALVLATVLYVLTKNIVAAGVIVVCVALVWLEQFEMGRRMRNGTYGSRPRERADLVRWIEKHEHAED